MNISKIAVILLLLSAASYLLVSTSILNTLITSVLYFVVIYFGIARKNKWVLILGEILSVLVIYSFLNHLYKNLAEGGEYNMYWDSWITVVNVLVLICLIRIRNSNTEKLTTVKT